MNILQIIGHRPTIKNTKTGARTTFQDYQQVCDYILRTGTTPEGLHQLPVFYQDMIGYKQPEPTQDHIIQLIKPEEGGLS